MKQLSLPRLCQPLRPVGLAVAIAMAVLGVGQAKAAPTQAGQVQVTVRGEGRPVLMVPGLNSAAAVWDETCAALQPGVQCHIAQLPGFAGAPAGAGPAFLDAMRDQLLAYLSSQPGPRFTLMGHSLGGALALMMAAENGARIERLVIVDTLPFLAGIRDPNATVESITPMATAMRDGMLASTPEQYEAQARPMMQALVHGEGRTTPCSTGAAAATRPPPPRPCTNCGRATCARCCHAYSGPPWCWARGRPTHPWAARKPAPRSSSSASTRVCLG